MPSPSFVNDSTTGIPLLDTTPTGVAGQALETRATIQNTHQKATAAHGATGAVVGTTNTQTLTNKTIDGGSNTITNIPQSAITNLSSDLAGKADVSALDAKLDATGDANNVQVSYLDYENVSPIGPLSLADALHSHEVSIGVQNNAKANRVSGATEGHLAALDGNGDLTDSGLYPSSFATPSDLSNYLPLTGGTVNGTLNVSGTSIAEGGFSSLSSPGYGFGMIQVYGSGPGSYGSVIFYNATNTGDTSLNITLDRGGNGSVTGNWTAGGTVTATSFVGDGSGLTGITATWSGGSLSSDLDLAGHHIYMNNNAGTGGGNLVMDSGYIAGAASVIIVDGGNLIFGSYTMAGSGDVLALADSTSRVVNMTGGTFNLHTGNGSGGGTLNMDGGVIQGANDPTSTIKYESARWKINGEEGVEIGSTAFFNGDTKHLGYALSMNDGNGSGGGTLNMDGGSISNAGDIEATGNISANGSLQADNVVQVMSPGSGVVVRSPNGSAWLIGVDDSGTLSATSYV